MNGKDDVLPGQEATRRLVGGRYDLIETIGRGGMGVVWRARDTVLQRDVAVKEIQFPPGTSEDEREILRRRVFREARAAARLSHPSVVTVYDVIEDDGQPFIVMELIDAPSLADVVRLEGPLTPARAAAVGLDVLAALEVAHAAGVVHRDIKPSNVMVPARGHCELTDFGIASVQDDPGVTSTGLVLGSPAYMAPEQGSRGVTSAASDLWSLGATLYFAVEGVPPFEGDGALMTLSSILNDAPRAMRRGGAIAPVLTSLLDKDPARRPGNALARNELERVVAMGSVAAGAAAPVATSRLRTHADDTLQLLRTEQTAAPLAASAAAAADHGDVSSPRVEYAVPARDRAASASGSRRGAGLMAALLVIGVLIAGAIFGFGRLGAAGKKQVAPSTAIATSPAKAKAPVAKSPAAASSPVPTGAASSVPGSSAPAPAASSVTPPSAPESAVAPSSANPSQPPAAAAESAAGVPADWVAFTHPGIGYTIMRPPGWTVRQNGLNTDIKDPATGAYLRVAHTTSPGGDATQAWLDYEPRFAGTHAGYRRIALNPTTYHGLNAGYWEFTYGRQRAIDLGFVTADRRYGFALNFQTPQSMWAGSQPIFDAFKASFLPPA